jgi:hypothetical protein
VQDYRIAVFAEKLLAFGHRRSVGRTGASPAVFTAAEFAFHAYPLGHDDFLGVNPFVVGAAFFLEYRIYGVPIFRGKAHMMSSPFAEQRIVRFV